MTVSVSDLAFCGVSERGQGSGLRQGGSLRAPQACRGGPVLPTLTPHHSGRERRKGGPLWLQVQGYVQPMTLCQDHPLVSTTAVLVTTRTGLPLQVRAL